LGVHFAPEFALSGQRRNEKDECQQKRHDIAMLFVRLDGGSFHIASSFYGKLGIISE
jgi:hypothetical protein